MTYLIWLLQMAFVQLTTQWTDNSKSIGTGGQNSVIIMKKKLVSKEDKRLQILY